MDVQAGKRNREPVRRSRRKGRECRQEGEQVYNVHHVGRQGRCGGTPQRVVVWQCRK